MSTNPKILLEEKIVWIPSEVLDEYRLNKPQTGTLSPVYYKLDVDEVIKEILEEKK